MSHMLSKPSCWMLRTEFELEPLLKQYLETYPDGSLKQYEILFKDTDEETGDFLYIMLHYYNKDRTPRVINLERFLDAHCQLHNKLGAFNRMAFPSRFDSDRHEGRMLGPRAGRRKT